MKDGLVLTQGPKDHPKATLALRDGEATLDGKARACVTAAQIVVAATGLGEVTAVDLRLRSSTMVATTTTGNLKLEAEVGECCVKAPKIRLN